MNGASGRVNPLTLPLPPPVQRRHKQSCSLRYDALALSLLKAEYGLFVKLRPGRFQIMRRDRARNARRRI